MPNYDLQGKVEGRVANQEVVALMAGNQLIWEKPPPADPTYWSTFDDAAQAGFTSHMDSPSGSWCATHFERYSGVDLEVTHVGIYLPAGAGAIGYSAGAIGLQWSTTAFVSPSSYANVMKTDTDEPFAFALAAGWNWLPFATPWVWSHTYPYMLAGYGMNAHYVHNASTITTSAIASIANPSGPASKFEMRPLTSGGNTRSWYSAAGAAFAGTNSRSYGIDIRVREA
jgi:hypothetical protein